MSSCTACGHRLGVGRFCANCGAPTDPSGAPAGAPSGDWRTDTAERAAVRATDPRTPPTASAAPAPPRYPMYADEVEDWSPDGALVTRTETAAEPAPEPEPTSVTWFDHAAEEPDAEPYDEVYDTADERRSPLLWIVAMLVVLALVAAAWWFLGRDDGSQGATDQGGGGRAAAAAPAAGVDVAGSAKAEAPRTAPPNADVNGEQVAYAASNMVDGVPDTTWRVAGDATGMALRFTLAQPTELTQVGLVNGYAKTSTDAEGRTFDWYAGNRRVTEVVWVFPGGTKVRQSLTDQREPQLIDIDPVTVGKVVLRIAKVSAPGEGTASRNYTAISEVSLIGTPASG